MPSRRQKGVRLRNLGVPSGDLGQAVLGDRGRVHEMSCFDHPGQRSLSYSQRDHTDVETLRKTHLLPVLLVFCAWLPKGHGRVSWLSGSDPSVFVPLHP